MHRATTQWSVVRRHDAARVRGGPWAAAHGRIPPRKRRWSVARTERSGCAENTGHPSAPQERGKTRPEGFRNRRFIDKQPESGAWIPPPHAHDQAAGRREVPQAAASSARGQPPRSPTPRRHSITVAALQGTRPCASLPIPPRERRRSVARTERFGCAENTGHPSAPQERGKTRPEKFRNRRFIDKQPESGARIPPPHARLSLSLKNPATRASRPGLHSATAGAAGSGHRPTRISTPQAATGPRQNWPPVTDVCHCERTY